jgi:hypothetical protein
MEDMGLGSPPKILKLQKLKQILMKPLMMIGMAEWKATAQLSMMKDWGKPKVESSPDGK